jgi:hypothetical protein
MSEPPTISARSNDASTALDEIGADSCGSAEITNGKKNARSPAIETITSVAFCIPSMRIEPALTEIDLACLPV